MFSIVGTTVTPAIDRVPVQHVGGSFSGVLLHLTICRLAVYGSLQLRWQRTSPRTARLRVAEIRLMRKDWHFRIFSPYHLSEGNKKRKQPQESM